MRKNRSAGLIVSTFLLLGASSASALNLEVGLFLSSSVFANPVTTGNIGPVSGLPTQFQVDLTFGDTFVVGVFIENDDAEDLIGVFASVVTDSSLLAFVSGGYYSGILAETGAMAPPSLNPGPPAPSEKPNSPKSLATGTTSWVQAVSHLNIAGTTGIGPDVASFLTYTYIGGGGGDFIDFSPAFTEPDTTLVFRSGSVVGPITLQGLNNAPEPGTALLLGLGLLGLGMRRRRL